MSQKEFLDEKIIAMINEVENQDSAPATTTASVAKIADEVAPEARTIYTGIKIKGKLIEFAERALIEERVIMMVPVDFQEMSQADAKLKYPSQERPQLILTDTSTAVNLMFNYLDQPIKNEDVATLCSQIINGMKRVNSSISIQEEGVEIVGDKNVAYTTFSHPTLNGKLYNLMYFVELDGRSLMISFNFQTKDLKYWKPVAFEMMRSLKFVEQSKNDVGELNE